MQKQSFVVGTVAEKIAEEAPCTQKIRGATGCYGLSRPIPQICVVLITIRRFIRLLVKLWSAVIVT